MQRNIRSKLQRLDSVLAQLDAAEQRALHDLRAAGYNFQTIERARRLQASVAAADQFNRDHDAALAAAFQEPDRARRTA